MYGRVNYTVVGFFITVFATAMLLFGFWLARYGFEQKYDYYIVIFNESVNGLSIDSTVKLNGVEVGKVSNISIDRDNPSRVKVLIKLKYQTPITKDMYAILNLQGITGLSYIEIKGGKKGATLLKSSPDNPAIIPSKPSLATKLIEDAPKILQKLSTAIDSFNRVLSNENIKNLSETISTTKEVSKKALVLENSYISLAKELNNTVLSLKGDINKTVKNLNSITTKVDKKLDSLIDDVQDATKSISSLSKNINKRLKRGEYDLRQIVRPIAVDIKELSYQYQELASSLKDISKNPSSIIFSPNLRKGPGE